MKTFKRHKDYGFWDQDIRLSKLSMLDDPLETLSKNIDFEMFRTILDESLHNEPKGQGGRRPYDYVMMFKILILQRYFNLSDNQVEYPINERMSFMRFLDLSIADDIPDSKTVWHFRERLTDLGVVEEVFALFLKLLEDKGMVLHEGKIIDASFVEVPPQRNNRAENEQIKEGNIPETFKTNVHKFSQKDTDARWTKKNTVSYFGYKDHVKTDSKSKVITKYLVRDASVHDSQAMEPLLDEKDRNQPFYADSAYAGEPQEKVIEKNLMENQVCEKGYRGHPLRDEQKASNKEKSHIRSRVEPIFGFMENSMNTMYIQCIGIKRATAIIGLMNLTYNMYRYGQLRAV
ncbi:hypothetical protein EZS27_021511 [termite gut metagenome]|uniref:Transposase IS4-like domain-containing protein n=1 Tax=termite gut metagenome TaxID=433724 RepID=A0A5J4RAG7_9ZZZZ